ncbi:MAG TPA: hypothetical protein PKK15_22060 [Kouleothrix sp.]|nr:hypothetical protein [Kouleothrix sp.]
MGTADLSPLRQLVAEIDRRIDARIARALRRPSGIVPGTYSTATFNEQGLAVAGGQGGAAVLRRASALFTLPASSITTITFDTREWDDGGYSSGGAPWSGLTLPKAGLYLVWWNAEMPTIGSGRIEFRVNDGSLYRRAWWLQNAPTLEQHASGVGAIHTTANGVGIALEGYQSSGASISIYAELGVTRLG